MSPVFAVYTEMAHVTTVSINGKKEATFAPYKLQFVIKFFTRRKTLKCRPRPSARASHYHDEICYGKMGRMEYVVERWNRK